MDNDLNVDVSIPSHISLKELIERYDSLLVLVNSHACTASQLQISDTKHLISIYHALILVCNIILILPIQISENQLNVIHSTIRRATILRNLCATDLDIETHDDDEMQSLKLVQIIKKHDDNDDSCYDIFEWQYESTDHNNNTVSAPSNNDNIISLSMTPEELLEEEWMLLHMANTPTPTETIALQIDNNLTAIDNEINSIRHILCQEWGERIYNDKVDQLPKN